MIGQAAVDGELANRIADLRDDVDRLAELVGPAKESAITALDLFHDYIGVLFVAFVVSLLATPIMRRLALSHGVIDRPHEARKVHSVPIAYLGGVAVYLGMITAVMFVFLSPFHGLLRFHDSMHMETSRLPGGVPLSILLGMTVIMIIGLWDDVAGIDPRAKIGGQLFAAAALAMNDVGVKVASGIMFPIARELGIKLITLNDVETVGIAFSAFGQPVGIDLVYWTGTAIIAVFVIGGCNASNLIDGLDGLLTGVTGIAAAGLLVLALSLAVADDGPLDATRIVLCMAVLGACLGFLPHNFNPATIFLGDCGSMLLGYMTIVIILTLGDTGRTHLVLAGLIIYAIPIMDTTLAIFRRKVSGKKISDADDQHLHHMLKRALGVKGAVLALYGLAGLFAFLGVMLTQEKARLIYALTFIFASFIVVVSFKIARRSFIERQAHSAMVNADATRSPMPDPATEGLGGTNGAGDPGTRAAESTGSGTPEA